MRTLAFAGNPGEKEPTYRLEKKEVLRALEIC